MSRLAFSEAAKHDRKAITAYTVQRFGIQQARRLRDRMMATLTILADSPLIGRRMKELDPPTHTFRYCVVMKSFIIVYEPMDDGIRVARILHGARNLAAELDRNAGDV